MSEFMGPGKGEEMRNHPALQRVSDPLRKAWLVAFAETGLHNEATEAVGRSYGIHYYWKKSDPEFAYAYTHVAQPLVADGLQDVAVRRATRGIRSYKFTSSGEPVRHPEECTCGEHLEKHIRRRSPVTGDPEWVCPGFDPGDPDAQVFLGVPYVEHKASDYLLVALLKGLKKDTFGNQLKVTKTVESIDYSKLPDHMLDRIVQGENPLNILAELAVPEAEASVVDEDEEALAEYLPGEGLEEVDD